MPLEGGDYVEQLRAMTGGRGPDVCVDAVGMEAHHGLLEKASNLVHAQVGSIHAYRDCLNAVRRGGVITGVGVYGVPYDNFPWGQMFEKGVRVQLGQVPVHAYIDELVAAVAEGKVKLDDVISHRVPLANAWRRLRGFQRQEGRLRQGRAQAMTRIET